MTMFSCFRLSFARLLVLGVLASIGFPAPAHASQVALSPVRLDLSTAEPIGQVTLFNPGSEPVTMEASVRIWNQSSSTGQWLLSSTNDLKAYPGIVEIPAQGKALVRVGLAPGFQPRSGQGTYRLFLRELVDPRPAQGSAVRMVLTVNLPVFVGHGQAPQSQFLSAAVRPGGIVNFTYTAPPGAAALAPAPAQYTWLDAQGKTLATTIGKIDAYALPGGLARWNQPLPVPCQSLARVAIQTEAGVRFDAPLSCPD